MKKGILKKFGIINVKDDHQARKLLTEQAVQSDRDHYCALEDSGGDIFSPTSVLIFDSTNEVEQDTLLEERSEGASSKKWTKLRT